MKAFTTITSSYVDFGEACLVASWRQTNSSVPLEVIVDEDSKSKGNGNFRSPAFDHHVANKMNIIANLVEREVDPFLMTDSDVFYFRSIAEPLGELASMGADILISREWDVAGESLNIGQLFIRPSSKVATLFRKVANNLHNGFSQGKDGPANQECLVANMRDAADLIWRPLPILFATTPIDATLHEAIRSQLISLHLIGTAAQDGKTSVERKWDLLNGLVRNHPANQYETI